MEYPTLEEALEIGGEITLLEDVTLDTVTIVTEPTFLNLNGHTIYTEVQGDLPIHVDTDSFIINADGGDFSVAEGNTGSFGFIKILSAQKFIVNGGTYTGSTNDGSFFRFEGNYICFRRC